MSPRNHSLAFLAAWREIKTSKPRQGGGYPNRMAQKQEERHIPPTIHLAAFLGVLLATTVATSTVRADWFGTGDNRFEIDFVMIGDPGNPADTTGDPNPAGSVPYIYRIGKYEISEQMINKANAASAEAGEPLGITTDNRGPDKPATRASWFEAARFVNWLNTSTDSTPAYKFDENGDFQLWEPSDPGFDTDNPYRNHEARYYLPSIDEWYKAAFYDPMTDVYYDFPTGSNDPPIAVASGTDPGTAVWNQPSSLGPADIMLAGGPSPFGTVGQGGNAWEWQETAFDFMGDNAMRLRGIRGVNWFERPSAFGLSSSSRGGDYLASRNGSDIGFRVAGIVSEPSTIWIGFSIGFALLLVRYRIFVLAC